jgi:hypothetical protein
VKRRADLERVRELAETVAADLFTSDRQAAVVGDQLARAVLALPELVTRRPLLQVLLDPEDTEQPCLVVRLPRNHELFLWWNGRPRAMRLRRRP